jgi:hypothetical protein
MEHPVNPILTLLVGKPVPIEALSFTKFSRSGGAIFHESLEIFIARDESL